MTCSRRSQIILCNLARRRGSPDQLTNLNEIVGRGGADRGAGRKNPSTGGFKLHADGFFNIREDAPVRSGDQLLEEVSVEVADASESARGTKG